MLGHKLSFGQLNIFLVDHWLIQVGAGIGSENVTLLGIDDRYGVSLAPIHWFDNIRFVRKNRIQIRRKEVLLD